jgi:hypothetical protein
MSTWLGTLVAIVSLTWSIAPAAAQDIDTSIITGTITDTSGAALSNAPMTLESASLIGGPRMTTTDRAGHYRFVSLPPGTYEVVAAHPGFSPARRRDIRLAGQAMLAVDFALGIAGVRDSVQVSVIAPVVDVHTAAAAVIVDRDLLENVPTDRVVAALMNLTPGVNVSAGLGGTQSSNPIYVDGVNITDPQQLAPAAQFNVNWLDELQVSSVGAGADLGEFNGIVETVRLRSGGNRLSGLAEYRVTPSSWVGSNTSSLTTAGESLLQSPSLRVVDWHDANAQVGGPLWKDRLWYFAGFQHFTNNVLPALVSGNDSMDERDRRALVKVTAAPASAVRLEGFYEYEQYRLSNDGLSPSTPVAATTTDTSPGHNWSSRATWVFGNNSTFELRHSALNNVLVFDPTPPNTRSGPPGHFDIATGVSSVNTTAYEEYSSTRHVTTGTWTRYVDGDRGRYHSLKVAGEYERAHSTWLFGYPGGRQYLDRSGAPFIMQESGDSSSAPALHRTTAFAQDDWSLTEGLTLQLGVRTTFNNGVVYQGSVVKNAPIDPRVGAAWSIGRRHATVLRAHVGRYHDAMLTAHFGNVDATPQPTTITSQFIDGQFVETNRSTQTGNYALDPDLSAAFFDQASFGVERQVAAHWSVKAQFVGRRYKDLVAVVDTGTVYQEVTRQDPGADGQLNTSDDGGVLTVYQVTNPGHAFYEVTNPPAASRHYSALQLIARKQYADNWQLQASYAWSSTHGNIDTAARSNAGGPEAGFNGVFANPNRAINADGSASFDFTHEVKVLGTWRMPKWGGVNFSGVYQYHTGLAWGRTVTTLPGIQATFGVRIEPRGTRRTDALNQLDLRAEKTFNLAGASRLGLFIDVFNVSNQGAPDPSKIFAVEFRSGPNFGQPLNWLAPRTARAGVRFSF